MCIKSEIEQACAKAEIEHRCIKAEIEQAGAKAEIEHRCIKAEKEQAGAKAEIEQAGAKAEIEQAGAKAEIEHCIKAWFKHRRRSDNPRHHARASHPTCPLHVPRMEP